MKFLALLLAGLSVAVSSPAYAGLFTDEEAQKKIQLLEARISRLEEANKRLEDSTRKVEESRKQLDDTNKQQARSMLDLLSQIDLQVAEVRKLRGQNEEFAHNLQEARQRQKDFYVDLDARLRILEAMLAEAKAEKDTAVSESRAFENAHDLFSAGSYLEAIAAMQEFIKKYPKSTQIVNAHFELGEAFFQTKDYKHALDSYQYVTNKFPENAMALDALFRIADTQMELKDRNSAKSALKKIVAKYPGSADAEKARKRLASLK